jgi:ATP-dependent Lhr-like helicase
MPSAVSPALAWAHPLVQEWFTARFSTPTEPQEQGWPHILAGHTTLISAPTGSGKTLAAFLACINRLVCKALAGELRDRTEVLYVSPLKALGNDIQKNLEIPLGEILQMAGERGLLMPQIRTAVRTGDTLMKDRRLMLKRPPHILVTTPESLYILLTAEKSRAILRDVETVIVDEIHAVADDKRGVHLSLSLERLEALTERPPVRIGLSATQKPIEEVAHFLAGNSDFQRTRPAPVIVNVGHQRTLDLGVEVPATELGPVASNEMWDEIYERIVQLVNAHRSTLVFVNTRRLAERIAHQLGERLGEENVAAHHGSLSRRLRLEAERKLKEGQIKVLVATASLELGIDVGSVDLVCHISSPRSIAVALQRVGRSGHWRGAVPKGRFFVTTRDDLAECAVLVRAIRRGELDRLIFPEVSLDVLAQQIVACCAAARSAAVPAALVGTQTAGAPPAHHQSRPATAAEDATTMSDGWDEEELFALVKRAYPYRNLKRETFDEVLGMLSEGIASQRGRYGAYLHHDRINRKLRARRGARLAAITSGGAIRPRRPRRRPLEDHHHRRALLRRRRRHAAHPARALRRPHQQGLGPRPAQALLPRLQLRAAGRRHRQRHQHLARRAAQLPARRRLPLPHRAHRQRAPRTSRHRLAHLQEPLALGRRPLSLQLLRMSKGKRIAPQIQRTRSDDLLASVFPQAAACFETIVGDIQIPDHPLVARS